MIVVAPDADPTRPICIIVLKNKRVAHIYYYRCKSVYKYVLYVETLSKFILKNKMSKKRDSVLISNSFVFTCKRIDNNHE